MISEPCCKAGSLHSLPTWGAGGQPAARWQEAAGPPDSPPTEMSRAGPCPPGAHLDGLHVEVGPEDVDVGVEAEGPGGLPLPHLPHLRRERRWQRPSGASRGWGGRGTALTWSATCRPSCPRSPFMPRNSPSSSSAAPASPSASSSSSSSFMRWCISPMSSKLEPDVSSMFSMSMTAEPPPCAGADRVSARSARLGPEAPPPPPTRPHLHVVLEAAPVGGGAAPAAARRRRGHGARPAPARAALAATAGQRRSTRM